jgi:hypothetical protein
MTAERPRLAAEARLRWDEIEQAHFLLWRERSSSSAPIAYRRILPRGP